MRKLYTQQITDILFDMLTNSARHTSHQFTKTDGCITAMNIKENHRSINYKIDILFIDHLASYLSVDGIFEGIQKTMDELDTSNIDKSTKLKYYYKRCHKMLNLSSKTVYIDYSKFKSHNALNIILKLPTDTSVVCTLLFSEVTHKDSTV